MQIIDGKAVAAAIKKEIAAEVENIIANGGKRPHLAAIRSARKHRTAADTCAAASC